MTSGERFLVFLIEDVLEREGAKKPKKLARAVVDEMFRPECVVAVRSSVLSAMRSPAMMRAVS